MKTILVAIVGGSGSGKSWLADRLAGELGEGAARMSQDDFYLDRSHLSPGRRARVNFDHPRAIDWPGFEKVLRACASGRPATLPRYDFSTHGRLSETATLMPSRFVLVEGLWLLRRPSVRKHFDYAVFVECPARLRLERRLARDQANRGRSQESILAQFRAQVDPMHRRFVHPQKQRADRVIASPCGEDEFRSLLAEIRGLRKEVSL